MILNILTSINNWYEIKVNIIKKRIYITLNGFWNALDQVPLYLADIQKAIELLDYHEFTFLLDATKFIAPSPEINKLHIESQKMLKNSGITHAAEISPRGLINKRTLNHYSKSSSLSRKTFTNMNDAEKWLDEVSHQ